MSYYDPDFMDLMVHTCTITLAAEATATSASYGHKIKSYSPTPEATYSGIRCRLRSLTADEQTIIGRESETVEDYYLYIPLELMPTTMKDHSAAARHQVTTVVDWKTGVVEHAGPLDVRSVRKIAGEEHHYLILVRKAG